MKLTINPANYWFLYILYNKKTLFKAFQKTEALYHTVSGKTPDSPPQRCIFKQFIISCIPASFNASFPDHRITSCPQWLSTHSISLLLGMSILLPICRQGKSSRFASWYASCREIPSISPASSTDSIVFCGWSETVGGRFFSCQGGGETKRTVPIVSGGGETKRTVPIVSVKRKEPSLSFHKSWFCFPEGGCGAADGKEW